MIKEQNEQGPQKEPITIVPYLYDSSSLGDVLSKYSKTLRKSNDLNDLLHANKLNEFNNILSDNKFL